MTQLKRPELLSPAGTLKSLRHAFAYGADAVYAGLPRYSLRVRNNNFSKDDNLAIGIKEAHDLGKKLFVAANILPLNNKVSTFIDDMAEVVALKPDALIMADPGLIMMVREKWPEVPIHLSVQANTMNYAAVKFWQSVGIERVILSRELSLGDIEKIRHECPDIELEVFVHGALCIAYSGRCLLSGYFNHRDANQGTCTNSCRWKYSATEAEEGENGDIVHVANSSPMQRGSTHEVGEGVNVDQGPLRPYGTLPPEGGRGGYENILPKGALERPQLFSDAGHERHPEADKIYFLEEEGRKGELLPVFEDEHGTYIMNSKDLRAIEHVERLVKMGIDCLKIEGRTKSHYYVARTAQAYRQAIDLAVAGKPFDPNLLGVLENLNHRGYTDGFYQRHHTQDYQSYISNASKSCKQEFVGEVIGRDQDSFIIDVKNHFEVGDRLEYVLPNGKNQTHTLDSMTDLDGANISVAKGSGHQIKIPAHDILADTVLVAKYL